MHDGGIFSWMMASGSQAVKWKVNKPTDPDHVCLLERSVEADTQILSTQYHRVNDIPFLIEVWNWEAIRGSTAVFLNRHVAGMNDADLQRFLTEQVGIDLGGGVTIKREKHTYVSFAFEAK
jgi:hypothetical protein